MNKSLPLLLIFLNVHSLVDRVKTIESGQYDGVDLFFLFLHLFLIKIGVDWVSNIWKEEDKLKEESSKSK